MPESFQMPKQLTVLGLPVHLLDDYSGWLVQRLNQRKGVHVVTLNAEMSMMAEQNAALANVIRQADLVIPDGAGVVFYLWLRGKQVRRHPGIELAEALLRRSLPSPADSFSPDRPLTIFFYGGAPGVCQAAAEIWQQRVPELAIVGTQHGYLTPEDQPQFRQMLKDLQPDIMLVGLGVPRQEMWIAEHRYLCPEAVWIGVGGSFDIWSGTKTRAPSWLRENHLEWVYRLYQEPWRWRRMIALPKFALRALVHSRS
ncbi:MAG: WecB/TagA/CpsF family glycosyltransferase [Leptolyngbyaceae cyanobacterium SM1_4_3]|nr:WecB/TagA/CpsF family glycosyltransferase [Leptolyngbyaceae cyanobacterium SM1_4_3]NJN91889.1 WecB/TagA/CpsF family glycosyltransferase [Leptolyngbyaceae cyanobacterium SL_5_14]